MGKRGKQEITLSEFNELLANSQYRDKVVTVEVLQDDLKILTATEEELRLSLEKQVEQAFYIAGLALKTLRDKRLYRSTHKTFSAYCLCRFGHSRQKANFLIAAAKIFQYLTTIGCQILPANERQIRPLNLLEPQEQGEAWRKAVSESKGKTPSGRLVRKIVNQIRERSQEGNPYQVGDICEILVNENPELTGKHKCWAIIRQIEGKSCIVACWDGEYQVNISHLKCLDYSYSEREELNQLEQRLRQFQDDRIEVESAAYSILENLGKLNRSFLTPLEEKLLTMLEQEYLRCI